jgi:hypothetical protein
VIADLAKLLNISSSRIRILSLRVGSLLVDYSIQNDVVSGQEVSASQDKLDTVIGSGSWLTETQAVYSSVSNETLTLTSAKVTSTQKESSICKGVVSSKDCPVVLAGAAVFFLFLCAIVVVLIGRHYSKKRRLTKAQQQQEKENVPVKATEPTFRSNDLSRSTDHV